MSVAERCLRPGQGPRMAGGGPACSIPDEVEAVARGGRPHRRHCRADRGHPHSESASPRLPADTTPLTAGLDLDPASRSAAPSGRRRAETASGPGRVPARPGRRRTQRKPWQAKAPRSCRQGRRAAAGSLPGREADASSGSGYRAGDGRDRSARLQLDRSACSAAGPEHHRGMGTACTTQPTDNFGHISIKNLKGEKLRSSAGRK